MVHVIRVHEVYHRKQLQKVIPTDRLRQRIIHTDKVMQIFVRQEFQDDVWFGFGCVVFLMDDLPLCVELYHGGHVGVPHYLVYGDFGFVAFEG